MKIKQFLLVLIITLSNIYFVFCQHVVENTAKKVAVNFYSGISNKGKVGTTITDAYTAKHKGMTAYYAFNFGGNNGFVIVSAEKKAEPILGYSFEGSFDVSKMPPQMVSLLKNYKTQISNIIGSGKEINKEIESKWQRYISGGNIVGSYRTNSKSKAPLLGNINWGQEYGYNIFCPADIEAAYGYTLVGCVGIAMGQIMKYHSFPVQGIGSHSYVHPKYGKLSADFKNTIYDWYHIPDVLVGLNGEIAELLYHLGVSVEMNYGPYESGAYSQDVVNALVQYFNYSSSVRYVSKSGYSDSDWITLITQELDNNRPVYYDGGTTEGHAFVCDGYDNTNKFHINWGWDGAFNGYYTLSNLNPGGSNFSDDQNAIIGIEPSQTELQIKKYIKFATCDQLADGEVELFVSGGTPPYSYLWSNDSTTSKITKLEDGIYFVTVTDASNDKKYDFAVVENSYSVKVDVVSVKDVSCPGKANGEITVQGRDGLIPYAYFWSTGATGPTITGLTGGNPEPEEYSVTVADSRGCTGSKDIGVKENKNIHVTLSAQVYCGGVNYTRITCGVDGGTPPYSYVWSNGSLRDYIDVYEAGDYSVTVTDDNDCTGSGSITIDEIGKLKVNVHGVHIYCGEKGRATANVQGGTGDLYYLWSTYETSPSIEIWEPGTYSVTVTNKNGCEGTGETTIEKRDKLDIELNSKDIITCNDQEGEVSVSKISGGVQPYTFLWSTGETGYLINVRNPGYYSVTVTDKKNCMGTAGEEIEEQKDLEITVEKKDVSCHGKHDGQAFVSGIKGGKSKNLDDYTYYWSNGGMSKKITDLGPGSYSVIVKEEYCSGSGSVEVIEHPKLELTINASKSSVKGCDGDQVTLTADATGGVEEYTYLWSTGSKDESIVITSPDTYACTVTDSVGCTAKAKKEITEDDCDDDDECTVPIIAGCDPNDIIGPEGYGDMKWISINETLFYKIRFENDPEFATAPVHKVLIKHPIDINASMYSFALGEFGFGDFRFQLQNHTHYAERLDLIDSLGIYVDFIAGLDVTKNEAFWIFQAIDPATGVPPEDPSMGFLMINDSITHRGEGFVTFFIKPKYNSNTGDKIEAYADIIFGVNDPIRTNLAVNTIDAAPPTSKMIDAIKEEELKILLSWEGNDDNGSGIASYNIYVSEDKNPFTLYISDITDTSVYFTGKMGSIYDFYTSSMDNTKNKELKTPIIETSTVLHPQEFFISPAEGDKYCVESNLIIDWNSINISKMNIELSNDSGATFYQIIKNIPVQDNPISWFIPDTIVGNHSYILRAINSKNNQPIDTSQIFFIKEKLIVDAGENIVACMGDSVLIGGMPTASNGVYPYTYEWTPSEGLVSSVISNPIAFKTNDYIVRVNDSIACFNSDTISVQINTALDVFFIGLKDNYCENGEQDTLFGYPHGGVFTGSGISGNIFNPANANPGINEIIYTYTNAHGCTNSDTTLVPVNGLPAVSISGLEAKYCINAVIATITVSPEGGILSGNGIVGNSFDPAIAGIGVHEIIYQYADTNGCSNNDTVSVEVYRPVLSIAGLDANYCLSADPVTVNVSPEGGVLTGAGINGRIFNPFIAGAGTHAITYTYTDGLSCTNDTTVSVNVHSLPIVILGNDTSININQDVLLDAGTGFSSYLWNDGSIYQTLLVEGTVVGIGTHEYWVQVANEHSCQNTDTINVIVDEQTGIELFNSLTIVKFYPNPNPGTFYLEVENHETNDLMIKITDPLGRDVFVKEYKNNKSFSRELINLSDKSKGVYLIKVTMSELTKVEKLIIY